MPENVLLCLHHRISVAYSVDVRKLSTFVLAHAKIYSSFSAAGRVECHKKKFCRDVLLMRLGPVGSCFECRTASLPLLTLFFFFFRGL